MIFNIFLMTYAPVQSKSMAAPKTIIKTFIIVYKRFKNGLTISKTEMVLHLS